MRAILLTKKVKQVVRKIKETVGEKIEEIENPKIITAAVVAVVMRMMIAAEVVVEKSIVQERNPIYTGSTE